MSSTAVVVHEDFPPLRSRAPAVTVGQSITISEDEAAGESANEYRPQEGANEQRGVWHHRPNSGSCASPCPGSRNKLGSSREAANPVTSQSPCIESVPMEEPQRTADPRRQDEGHPRKGIWCEDQCRQCPQPATMSYAPKPSRDGSPMRSSRVKRGGEGGKKSLAPCQRRPRSENACRLTHLESG